MVLLLISVTVLLLKLGTTYDFSSDNAEFTSCDSFTWPEFFQDNFTAEHTLDLLYSIWDCIPQELPQPTVKRYLDKIMNHMTTVMNNIPSQYYLNIIRSEVLDVIKTLVSTLVNKTSTYRNISFSAQSLEVVVVMIGPDVNQYEIPSLNSSYAFMDIDLVGLSKINEGSAAVAFMSYINMTDIFLSTVTNATKTTMMSTVVSTTLPNTSNTDFNKPANFILKHITNIDPEAFLFCMDLETNEWDTCYLTHTNSTHSVCSCNSLTTLALISQTQPCRVNLTEECAVDFLNQIQYNIAQELPQETVERYLTTIMNLTTVVIKKYKCKSYGNILMNIIEKLVSALVNKTDTYNSSVSLQNLEVQVFMVGSAHYLNEILTLITSYASMDINLTGISQKSESAAVAFISYTNMADILTPSFDTFTDTKKTIISTVVSATLPNTNTNLNEPVRLTFKYINELAPESILSCMYWEEKEWVTNYCNITETNSSHTLCSCDRLGTFALIMQTDPCMGFFTAPCMMDFLHQIPDNIPQELPEEIVKNYLNIITNLSTHVTDTIFDQKKLKSYGNSVLNVSEQLVYTLVRKGDTYCNISLSLQNLEVRVFMVGVFNVSLNEILRLTTENASMDISLVEMSKNELAAVAFMSYTNMTDILKPTFFKTITNNKKTMMSTVVLATLPKKTTKTQLTKSVNITFKHTNELDPEGILSCVNWKTKTWFADACSILQTNSSHTICTCNNLSTFALIMQTDPCRSDRLMNTLIAVAIIVGLVFLSLSILTFALYSRNPVTNVALINLCINLLLFHIFSLIKTLFLAHIHPLQLRAALAGVQYFFLMLAFVWMLIEAVLLYFFMKNLSKFRSSQGQVLCWKWLTAFGYLIPLGVLGASAVRFPKGYIDEECWLKEDGSLIFIFAGPVLFIVTVNLSLYLIIIIIMIFTYKHLKNEILQMRNTANKNLIICVTLRSLTQLIILVCYWIFLYIPSKNGVLYHAFQLLNSQQGTFIFLVHCLLHQEVRQKYRKVLSALCFSNNTVSMSGSVSGQPEDSQDD